MEKTIAETTFKVLLAGKWKVRCHDVVHGDDEIHFEHGEMIKLNHNEFAIFRNSTATLLPLISFINEQIQMEWIGE